MARYKLDFNWDNNPFPPKDSPFYYKVLLKQFYKIAILIRYNLLDFTDLVRVETKMRRYKARVNNLAPLLHNNNNYLFYNNLLINP